MNSNLNRDFLDIRHVMQIDSLPIYNTTKEVLTVGCGDCKVDNVLLGMGYTVFSTDYHPIAEEANFRQKMKDRDVNISIYNSNIFDLSTFPKNSFENTICAEVLEHLPEYKLAFNNLLALTKRRLIIGVPWEKSYNDTRPTPIGHCNFWNDTGSKGFKNINEFKEMSRPYAISIQKIRTKSLDIQMNQYSYLIVIDKKQKYNV